MRTVSIAECFDATAFEELTEARQGIRIGVAKNLGAPVIFHERTYSCASVPPQVTNGMYISVKELA